MRTNKQGEVLFSEFRKKTNAESLDELDGYTIRVYELDNGGVYTPRKFHVDHDAKEIHLIVE